VRGGDMNLVIGEFRVTAFLIAPSFLFFISNDKGCSIAVCMESGVRRR